MKQLLSIKTEEYKKYVEDFINSFNASGKQTIVMFCDTYYPIIDGVVNVMDNCAKCLSKKYNVVVCVPVAQKNMIQVTSDYLVLACKSQFINFLNYAIAKPKADATFKQYLEQIKNIIYVHIHSPFYIGKFALKWAKEHHYPVYATFHSQYKLDFYQYSKSKMITAILLKNIMKVFNNCDKVQVLNEKCKALLYEYGCTHQNVVIIPNGIDSRIVNETKVQEVITNYHLKQDVIKLLFVGRIVKLKNVDFVVDVVNYLKNKKHLDFQMIFVGDSPYKKKVEKRVNKYGLDNVIFTGQISDKQMLDAFYAVADLFVFPSIYDSFPLVKIEASMQKLPGIFLEDTVIAGDVIDNVNGFIGKNNVAAFGDKVYEVIQQKELLKKVGQKAKDDFVIPWDEIVAITLKKFMGGK